jgi:hypothetical protein
MENTVSHNHHANLTSTTNVGETPDVNHDTGDYGNYLDDRSRLGDKAFSPFEAMAMIALNEAATDLNKICDKVNAGNARQTASNEKANDVDAAIAKIIAASGDGSTADLPQGVIDYMKEHNITVTAHEHYRLLEEHRSSRWQGSGQGRSRFHQGRIDRRCGRRRRHLGD